MAASTTDFLWLPLFNELSAEELGALVGQCDESQLAIGHVVFEAGDEAAWLTLLVDGAIEVAGSDGEKLTLSAPAVVGELGVVSALARFRTARVTAAATVLRISRPGLLEFLVEHPVFAFKFQQNLLAIVSDKIVRDQQRLVDMRSSIVRTQRAMKELRTYVLEELDTVISEDVHDTLESLIAQNRRVNYRVMPARALAVSVRGASGETHSVVAISRARLTLMTSSAIPTTDSWHGVLVLPAAEIPVAGTWEANDDGTLDLQFGHMLDDDAQKLEDYLTRAQSLDVLF